MAKYNTRTAPLLRGDLISAWKQFAANESFAGMTLAEFEARTAKVLDVRDEIQSSLTRLAGLRRQRDAQDKEQRNVMAKVVLAIRMSDVHGEDSPLYTAVGYVAKSDRASGLTRAPRGVPSSTGQPVRSGSGNEDAG